MITNRINRKNAGNRGVAIVIVLGLIAVLMMMAVAFSIHMRIERTGAANYRYGVQARHMVYAGLANAIRDIDGLMKDVSVNPPKPIIYPKWDVAVSTQGTMNASVLSHSSAEFIPELLREVARKKEAKWNLITDENDIQRGRYAFVIINSSGLLDANEVGGQQRLSGADSEEIRLHNDIGVTGHTQFIDRAASDVRYETFPEFINKNPYYLEISGNKINNSFSMFSLTPMKDQYDIDGFIKDRVYIGPDTSKWDKDDIIGAFADAGVPNPTLAYLNLLDYTDADSVPQDLAAGCVEMVPMINELGLLCSLSRDAAGNLSGTNRLYIEWVYPFVTSRKDVFKMHYDVEVTEGAGNAIAGSVPAAASGSFDVADITYGIPISPLHFNSVNPTPVAFSGNSTDAVVKVNFDVRISAYIEGPDGRVDEVPSPYDLANGAKFTVNVDVAKGSSLTITNMLECLDPRFNWNPSSTLQWYPSTLSAANLAYNPAYSFTYRAQNFRTKYFLDPVAYGAPKDPRDLDDDIAMHVADRPLQNVGELGYLCYDYWRTIRLYEHQSVPSPYPTGDSPHHKVLDKFTIWDQDYRRGLVNINTTNVDVLASAFYQMPEEEYSTNRLTTWVNAQQIAQEIINKRPYTNLSELGKAQIDWDALTTGPTEICKESGIRNSVGMLTARDNFFTIIIRADSFSAGVGGKVGQGMTLATTRAVAEVWRDPIPDENGNNRSLVRSFRFVED